MSYFNSCIYSGLVTHERYKPKKHFFSYKTFSLLIDLNEIGEIEKKIKFFSYNKFNILSFYNIDHGNRDGNSLVKWVKNILKKSKINFDIGKIKLLCYPRFFGYVFNEQHTYVFRCTKPANLILHKCNKKFYVSPFIEMKTSYNFRLLKPGKKLNVLIKQNDENGLLLIARQSGKRLDLTSKNLLLEFLKHPLMSAKVIIAIHFEAFRLWIKGIKHVEKKRKIKNNTSLEN